MIIKPYDPEQPITEPGFYRMTEEQYHADPCAVPSLSASLIKRALPGGKGCGSMRHLRFAHPKLAPIQPDQKPTKAQTMGNCFHKLILKEGPQIEVVAQDDWRTNAAKDARDTALKEGRIAVLAHQFTDAQQMLALVEEQVAQMPVLSVAMMEGVAEIVAVWTEETPSGTIWCRARIDWLTLGDQPYIIDWKTTETSASPDDFGRNLYDGGADIQASWYERGIEKLTGNRKVMLFAAVEQFLPHALAVHRIDRSAMDMAKRKIEFVTHSYAACLAEDVWPGYPPEVAWQEMPPWHERKWIEREDAGLTTSEFLQSMIEQTKVAVAIDADTAADFGLEPNDA